MNAKVVTLRCLYYTCRIQTFTGTLEQPLSACPVCQSAGIQVPEGSREPVRAHAD